MSFTIYALVALAAKELAPVIKNVGKEVTPAIKGAAKAASPVIKSFMKEQLKNGNVKNLKVVMPDINRGISEKTEGIKREAKKINDYVKYKDSDGGWKKGKL